jgi:phosphoglycolate phosphatase-like HAD superfamily hydrolase
MSRTFAIDFDGTLLDDPKLWLQFIASARESGHRVLIVTARTESAENVSDIKEFLISHGCEFEIPIILTGRSPKRWHVGRLDIHVDVWIDDDPESILMGR